MNILKNDLGFSLTEALISLSLLGVVFLSASMGLEKINTLQQQNSQLQSSELIKNSLYSILDNPKAWQNTESSDENKIFKCLNSPSTCKGKEGYIKVVKQSNDSVYFVDDGDSGFMANGRTCKKSIDGDKCFLSVKLKARYLCDGECKSPLLQIDGNFFIGNNNNSSSINSLNFQMLKSVKSDPCALGCRQEILNPSIAVESKDLGLEAEELKIVMVVDNSSSMKAAQEYLNNGLKSLIRRLRSLNINTKFYIYTTTQFEDDGRQPSSDISKYSRYEDFNGIWHETTGWFRETYVYDIERVLTPNLLPPVGGEVLELSKDMSESDFNDFEQRLENLLTSSDGVGVNGSSQEQGLCTVARTLFDDGPNSIFSSGDNTLFLIVTDENDDSESNCFSKKITKRECDSKYEPGGYTTKLCDQDNPSSCDRSHYKLYSTDGSYKSYRRILVECSKQVLADGEYVMKDGVSAIKYWSYANEPCSKYPYGPGFCGEKEKELLKRGNTAFCNGENDVITACSSTCVEKEVEYNYYDYNKETVGIDLMSNPVTIAGVRYANLAEYVNSRSDFTYNSSSKYIRYVQGQRLGCEDLPEELSTYQEELGLDPTRNSLKDAIKQKADSLFGEDGYSMSLIINDEELNKQVGCSMVGEQSFGSAYKQLANRLKIPGGVSSICSTDYSAALNNIGSFAEKVAGGGYKTIQLSEGERVLKITTKSDEGNEYTLSTPEDYTVKGLVITLTESFVAQSKYAVNVHIAKDPPKLNQIKPAWMSSNSDHSR